MNKTLIEWCDFTVNPLRFRNKETGRVGHHCAKISPGCKNCYSSAMQSGPYLSGLTFIEENKPKGEFFLDEKVLQQVIRRKKPCRIFWCDMTDMFLEDYPDEWIGRCFDFMAETPRLTHQVLTKRSGRLLSFMTDPKRAGRRVWPLPNVWLGVSVEDRARKERIDLLRETPAAVRFLSLEPLLEDLGELDLRGIDWVIVGGESGPGARPFWTKWARDIIAQCRAASVPVFCKQLGDWPICCTTDVWPDTTKYDACELGTSGIGGGDKPFGMCAVLKSKKGGDMSEWPEDLRVRQMPEVSLAL